MLDNDDVRKRSTEEADQRATDNTNDVSGCLKKCLFSDTRLHALKNVILIPLSPY